MFGALIGAGAGILGNVLSSHNQKKAAERASDAQVRMANASIDEQRRQFDATKELLNPYVQAGNKGLGSYIDLLGLNGSESQQTAIDGINNSPLMQSQYKQAENAILQNASATGGLRGGNTQEALADNRSNMLYNNVLSQQQMLGNLASLGQNSATGVGNMGIGVANNISGQLNGIGQAQAGYQLARGNANANLFKGIGQTIGSFGQSGGFDKMAGMGGIGSILGGMF